MSLLLLFQGEAETGGESATTGIAGITFGALTTSAAGTLALSGTATTTFDALTSSAIGFAGTAGFGLATVTLGAMTGDGTGELRPGELFADADITLGSLTGAGAGELGPAPATSGEIDSVRLWGIPRRRWGG